MKQHNTPSRLLAMASIFSLFFSMQAFSQTITTYAGGIGDFSVAPTYGRLSSPTSVAVDASGNLYISDSGNNRIRKVTAATSIINTIAGNGIQGATTSGSAVYAELTPRGIVLDGSGNIYLASGNSVIKISASDSISIVAGTGIAGYSGDGSAATAATLNSPVGLAIDASGNIYIADEGNAAVRKVSTSGVISTIAGGGGGGIGDGGPATSATVNPYGVAVDATGNVYIADQNNERIRKINTSGIISTVAGNGTAGYSGDGGAATAAELYYPFDVVVDASGNLYVPDRHNNRVRKISAAGIISTVAGNGTAGFSGDGGAAVSAELNDPAGVSVDGSGNLYISDDLNNRVRKVNTSGTISTLAGNDTAITGYGGSGVTATLATLEGKPELIFLDGIYGCPNVYADKSGNVYIAEEINHRVRKINSAGVITTIAGTSIAGYSGDGGPATSAELKAPSAVAVDQIGNIYIADYGNHRIRIIDTAGTINTFAGGGIAGLGDGGPATLAVISAYGVCVDKSGSVYIADGSNNRIRKVDTAGIISTVAGTGTYGESGDGGSALSAEINEPYSVAIDKNYNLYISEPDYGDIRKVSPGGVISLFASVNAYEITVDTFGNVYAATNNEYGSSVNEIIEITPSGVVTSVAGNETAGCVGDGGPASAAEIMSPFGVTIDQNMNLYVLETGRVRKICCMGSTTLSFLSGSTATLSACTSSSAINIDSLLQITDDDTSATETWSVSSAPSHGTLSGFPHSATFFGGTLTPTGLTYRPTTGYSGSDAFTIKVSNGTDTAVITVNVTTGSTTTAGTISALSSTLCTSTSMEVYASMPGGTWSSSDPSVASVSGSGEVAIVTGLTSGTDTIKYRIATTCGTATATYVIDVSPTPTAISGTTGLCVAGTTTLTDTYPDGTWSSSFTAYATVSSTGVVTGVGAGVVSIYYTLLSGCAASIPVTVTSSPYAGVIGGPTSVCAGSSITLSDRVSGGTWSASNSNATVAGATVTGVTAGVDTITYTLVTGCGTATATYVVTVTASATTASISGPSTLCVGASATMSDAVTCGIWSCSYPYAIINSTTGVIGGIVSGSATVTYEVSGSCGTASTTATIVVQDAPSAGMITGSATMCTGSSDTLTDTTAGGVWSSTDPSIATVSSTGVVSSISDGVDIIYYTVTNSCGSAEALTIINVAAASPIAYITGATDVCAGSTTTLGDVTPAGTWSSGDPGIASVSSTGIVTGIATGVTTISYTASLGCGLSIATAEMTVNTTPTAGSIEGPTTICAGATGLLSESVSGGVWSVTNSDAAISPAGVVTGNISGDDTVLYTVTNGCGTDSTQYTIAVNTAPTAGIISGAGSLYTGATITLSDTATGGTWSVSNTAIASIDTSGIVTGIGTGADTIYYTVSGCGSTATTAVAITVSSIDGISGDVIFGSGAFTGDVTVWLITYDPTTLELAAIDSVVITCTGATTAYYQFTGIPTDSFRIKAAVSSYSSFVTTGYVPTYHTSSYYWNTADVLYHVSGTSDIDQNINMSYGAVIPGPVFVSGSVTSGAGRGTSAGVPAVGLLIFAIDEYSGALMQQTYTDASGNYSFSNLPIGTYEIYPEELNYATTPYLSVALTPSADTVTGMNFVVHTTNKTITPAPTGINNVSGAALISTYPNPATESITISWQNQQDKAGTLTITDVLGRTVLDKNISFSAPTGTIQQGVASLQDGTYNISILSDHSSYSSRLVIVNK